MEHRLRRITSPELLRARRRASWRVARQRGSHVLLEHAEKPGRLVTVAIHPGRVVPLGTLNAILEAAELSVDELNSIL